MAPNMMKHISPADVLQKMLLPAFNAFPVNQRAAVMITLMKNTKEHILPVVDVGLLCQLSFVQIDRLKTSLCLWLKNVTAVPFYDQCNCSKYNTQHQDAYSDVKHTFTCRQRMPERGTGYLRGDAEAP